MKADLKNMSRKELTKLRADVDKALDKVSEREKKLALDAAEKAAASFGFSLSELGESIAAAPKKRGRKPGAAKVVSAPKYANPADKSQTWTGKGRQPLWFKEAVAAGVSPESMAL